MLYHAIKPLLFRLDAERAHDLITGLLRLVGDVPLARAVLQAWFAYEDPQLSVSCAGLHLSNPVGLAAGFDKQGTLIAPMAALGFGHVEVGTVTPRPQPGNDLPRMFRLPEDHAVINRLGFNSTGMSVVARRLSTTKHRIPIGINIGKNRTTPLERSVEDYVATFVALVSLADYVTVNISSPNTPGLRQLHERTALETLLRELMEYNQRLPHPRPLFLKVSPDETAAQLDDVVRVALDVGITGFIACNTTLARDGLCGQSRDETGGLSGRPLTVRARESIAYLYRSTAGRLPIIGVGGVATAEDAYGHIGAGATLVQLYTGLVYEGPGCVQALKAGLVRLIRRDGLSSIQDAIGVKAF
ncbi:MAG: quinone-dependent dihydroorotate dehydrogenase [Chloroflexi bacterium AL-W]|nr:quinone-dependent dihydroorotate dehydrogenase [Chloroflexi bacterium AL-N1]NOK70204.1 quinone-dependent dihydroorotate dehydrogenase [Chloroflexi bacterium AL-N10]NOK77741.1 quinone-dependent dihydroorotate dehydrogenase [Chloroflexi bacterium AL-N5]NOK84750.1 quinone-dependent dihydroorotate dehydrogenase [Chloroflexi bacterium AL-W]NOK93187.1 quinone-dependent dihydroorotate dehydrogenase [Chloroflexi bacterium AL-N15]